jgi:hypothetical protein
MPRSMYGAVRNELTNQWLRDVAKPNVRPWTYRGYEVVVRCHLTPDLGSLSLVKMSPQQVQALLNRKLESGLSPKTVQSIRGCSAPL